MDRQFGRRYAPDPRDARFPMRAALPARVAIVSKFYQIGPILDQGNTPQCVGYSGKQFLQSDPVQTMDGPSAEQLYHEAQQNDEWPGEDYDGTSVRGLAKALTNEGRLLSYVWGASAADVRDFLITQGTVIMGTDWLARMMTPDKTGLLKVSGSVVGGHAYLLTGFDASRNCFQMTNSWGEGWGLKGQAYIRFADLDKLIAAQGEACAALEQAIAPLSDFAVLQNRVTQLEARVTALEARVG